MAKRKAKKPKLAAKPAVEAIRASTRPKQAAFLEAFIQTATIATAARAAGIERKSHYNWMEEPEYAEAFAEAEKAANELMIAEAKRRGCDGVFRLKFHQGNMIMIPGKEGDFMAVPAWERCEEKDPGAEKYMRKARGGELVAFRRRIWMKPYVEHEYSDRLLEFMIKARNPEYRDKHEHEHKGELAIKLYDKDAPVEDV